MRTARHREVVRQLVAGVVEDARPAGVAAERAESGDGNLRYIGVRRLVAVVRGPLTAEFVHRRGAEDRLPARLQAVAPVPARVVRALGNILLRRVEVEVGPAQPAGGDLHVQGLTWRNVHVRTAEERRRVVGAALLALERLQRVGHHDTRGLRLELHDEGHTQVVLLDGREVERLARDQGAAERSAELVLLVVQLPVERIGRCQRPVAVEVEEVAARRVGAGLRHHVHKAGRRPAHFGAEAGAHHLKFIDRRLREEEHRLVPAALVALQRVVEVGAVDRYVRVDRPLTGDDHPRAVGLLDDGRRQLRELGEAPSSNRQVVDRRQRDVRARGLAREVEHRRGCRYGDRLGHSGHRQRQRQAGGFADTEQHPLLMGREAGCLHCDLVLADRESGQLEATRAVADGGTLVACIDAAKSHGRTGDRPAVRIEHRAGDGSGAGRGLREERSGDGACRSARQEDAEKEWSNSQSRHVTSVASS